MSDTQRGYLWQYLRQEVEAEFYQPHPFVQLYDSIPFWQKHGWHIEGELGDMSGVRKSEKHRRGEPSTPSVRELRERRKVAGLCIDCGLMRDAKSKNFCPAHREKDRLCAESKRTARRREMNAASEISSEHVEPPLPHGARKRLPDFREGLTHHFTVIAKSDDGGIREVDGYVQTGLYNNGKVGEIFLKVGKMGDEAAALDMWAISFSMGLQAGIPLEDFCKKFINERFEPSGATKNKDIPRCSSIVDYVSRWLLLKYGKKKEVTVIIKEEEVGI